MKIGIFDSGLGGLLIARAIRDRLPDYDLVYLGDTLHMPYGPRSADAIYDYSRRAMDFLLNEQECRLVILACNSASVSALRRLQQDYLPAHADPSRRILGVVVPTLERAAEGRHHRIGLLGTNQTIASRVYEEELRKINPAIRLYAQAAPLLVPLIEHDGMAWLPQVLDTYLAPLKAQGIDSLILGCTHYSYIKAEIAAILGPAVTLLSQDDIIPDKLADYLNRHPEIETTLTKTGHIEFYMTDITENYSLHAAHIFGEDHLTIHQAEI